MTLSIIGGFFSAITGAGLSILGVLFLIASRGSSSRLITGAVILLSGVMLIYFGVKFLKKGFQSNPEYIKKSILKEAKLHNGELPETVILGISGDSVALQAVLSEFLKTRIAIEKKIDGRKYYVFNDFNFTINLKKCPYCGNDYPVRDDIESCPSCGGDLKLEKSKIANGEEKFSLDDDLL